jgi:hypothetical protein
MKHYFHLQNRLWTDAPTYATRNTAEALPGTVASKNIGSQLN